MDPPLTSRRLDCGVDCRLHDLGHTFATTLAENGVPESTMLALMGQMSRAMLERYLHIRMSSKREAIAMCDGAGLGWTPNLLDLSGERGRNRTYNLLIKSQLLCQLSYAP